MPFEVHYLHILPVRPESLIARCAILSHEPKITEATLVSSPPRSPPSERFHLATTYLISLGCAKNPPTKTESWTLVIKVLPPFLQVQQLFTGLGRTVSWHACIHVLLQIIDRGLRRFLKL